MPTYVLSPSLGVVVKTIDHGTVAYLQHRPAIPVLLVCLHQNTEQKHHAPVPAALQCYIEFGASSLVERRWRDEEDIVHPHIFVVAAKGPAVHELLAEEVSVPNIKAAEDLNLWSFASSTTTIVSSGKSLHATYQPSDVTAFKLLVFSIGWREPKSTKPGTVKIVQIMANFFAEIFQVLMFLYVLYIPCA